jgi:hypothetical protein
MRGLDFSSWQALLSTLLGLALITLIGMGVRLLMMFTVQQRRERMNRQINERLRTLIAAYKVLGGSFTGNLAVDPAHLGESRRRGAVEDREAGMDLSTGAAAGSDRTRRIRDAVEAALSDIILLGTEEQVRLAAGAARELAAGHPAHTHELVVSLRGFVRDALDLDPIPAGLVLPAQGPTRPSSSGGRGKAEADKGGSRQGGGAGGVGMGGMGSGAGTTGDALDPNASEHRPG